MSDVAFVFTNPRHHLEMMGPVADELGRRGIASRMVSLSELRGYDTPAQDRRLIRAIPFNLRRRPADPTTPVAQEGAWKRGRLAQRAVWQLAVGPRMRQLLRRSRVVVVPNDTAYPYTELLAQVHGRGARSVLMQEGIRFPPEKGYTGAWYGTGGATAICAWGEGGRDYFRACNVPDRSIVVTGAPRLDELSPAPWRDKAAALLAAHRIAAPPIAFLSNPIETQGFGTREGKLALFAQFLAGAAPLVGPARVPIVVKNHPAEDPSDYARVAAASPIAELVTVLGSSTPIFAALAASRAAVVLTSTVGLEALVFGIPVGVMEIPGFDYVFDYVQRGAGVPLPVDAIGPGVAELLDGAPARRTASAAFLERHLADRGRARGNVASVIERVLRTT